MAAQLRNEFVFAAIGVDTTEHEPTKATWKCFKMLYQITRHLGFAVVRRLFKMGPKMVERRLKAVRRLLHPLLVAMCAMLISDDAYFILFSVFAILLLVS